jgi:GGDEF domain-containing protein
MALRETDIRTGLYTPGFFIAFGARELSFARKDGYPLSVLTVVIEADESGKLEGTSEEPSAILRAVGRRIQERAGDNSIVARVGENRISVLLPRLTYSQAMELADSIRTISLLDIERDQSGRGVAGKRKSIRIRSVGVASTRDGVADFSDLLRASQDAIVTEKIAQ